MQETELLNARRGSPELDVLRFLLATPVIYTHTHSVLSAASTAVEGFFCISGYFITMISQEVYRGRPGAFLANRFLRIYPIYWVCALFSLATLYLFGVSELAVKPTWPDSGWSIFANFAIFGLDSVHNFLLPVAWSLGVEVVFYLVIGLGTARSRLLTIWGLAISLVLLVLALAHIVPFDYYGSVPGNSFAFFLGSLAWHERNRIRVSPKVLLALGIAGFAAAFVILPLPWKRYYLPLSIIAGAPAAACILAGLARLPVMLPAKTHKFAALLGRLSYIVFLLHDPMGCLINHFTRWGWGMALFVTTAIVTILAAAALDAVLGKPLARLRAAIRTGDGSHHPPRYA